ncbi:MAG: nucleotide pyrophosphohydrolase [Erysipelotrichaceae bacterium]|nr:nucleotide pyrophosphohydrolase [Erysipelotrichaceae bacterium]
MNKEIIENIKAFVKERDWEQFHTSENLAKSISIEANELLELFQWSSDAKNVDRIKDELADIFIYSILLANKHGLNIEQIILEKIELNKKRYPKDKAKGNAKKYTEFE